MADRIATPAALGRMDGKVALITGASSGIGAGTAVLFSQLGAQLALVGRNEENLKKIGEECEKNSQHKPLLLVADLAKEEDVQRVVTDTIAHYSKLDILVNSAGILEIGGIESTSMEQYDRVFNINCRSMYQIIMLSVPHLVDTKGSIVNVSSVNGIRSFPNVLAYCMSKSAVDQMTRCIALELAPKQVRVNSVNPGVIKTNCHYRAGLDEEAYQKFLERTQTTHALGRPGTVEEAANAIAFLASESSSFITGAQLPVDGGRHAMCPR